MGSVTSDVVSKSPIPLVIPRPDSRAPTKITSLWSQWMAPLVARLLWARQSVWQMPPARVILGSVADAVVRQAQPPVLLVPHGSALATSWVAVDPKLVGPQEPTG
jgi:hypothetical protein